MENIVLKAHRRRESERTSRSIPRRRPPSPSPLSPAGRSDKRAISLRPICRIGQGADPATPIAYHTAIESAGERILGKDFSGSTDVPGQDSVRFDRIRWWILGPVPKRAASGRGETTPVPINRRYFNLGARDTVADVTGRWCGPVSYTLIWCCSLSVVSYRFFFFFLDLVKAVGQPWGFFFFLEKT